MPETSRKSRPRKPTKNAVSEPRAAEGEPHELDSILNILSTLWALKHALERTSLRMETVLGVTAQQRVTIRLLGKLGTTTPGELAAMLHIDRGTVTAMIKRLEARQLVVRKPHPEDGRRTSLVLTARGRKLDVPTPISVERAVTDLMKDSSEAELRTLQRVLGRLVARLDAMSESVDALRAKRRVRAS